jgi:transposase-like protein
VDSCLFVDCNGITKEGQMASIDYSKVSKLMKQVCPKCKSTNTIRTGLFKQAIDTKHKMRREFKQYKCKDCNYEFWK